MDASQTGGALLPERSSSRDLSDFREHMEMAAAILRVHPSVPGDVVECGCFVGGSSVNLSIVCGLVSRRLLICDSFEGLPEPSDHDRWHTSVHVGHTDISFEGRFAAPIDVVRDNLARFGNVAVCDFKVGFYDQTMNDLRGDVVLAFLDVDLIDSLRPCVTAIWPLLADGCRLYLHEARNLVSSPHSSMTAGGRTNWECPRLVWSAPVSGFLLG